MIVDAHLDIAWNALAEGRGFDIPTPHYLVTRDALLEAEVGLVFATIFTAPRRAPGMSPVPYGYATPREAYLLGRTQLSYYRSLGLPLVATREDLQEYVRDWRPGHLAAVLLMENADPIEAPAQLGEWADHGLRLIGPAWSRTRYCGGTHAPGGLTEDGRALLRAMRRRGMVLDISHMADRSVRDSLEMWTGPIMASHVGARALCARQRLLTDQVIGEVAARGGVLGVSFCRFHLREEGRATLDDVLEHVDHFVRVTGDPAHIGVGSDLDGGFDADDAAVRSLSEMPTLRSRLRQRYGEAAAEGMMGGNWLRFLEAALPSRTASG